MNAEVVTAGLVGLGLVGTALGARLRAAGYRVQGWDSDPQARARWAARGGDLASSLPALSTTCAQVVLAVFDSAGVLEVVEGGTGLLVASGPTAGPTARPTAIVDCSTGDPVVLEALGARLAAQDIDFIEAPLSGSSRQIEEGDATMLLGGSAEALARHGALLCVLAARRVHMGGAGMGARAKLATNLVLGLNRAAFAEGLVFAERMGIAPQAFLELVLATPARSDAALAKGARMISGDFKPQSRIRQHLKDLELMLRTAAAAGDQRLPLTEVHAALLRAAVAAGDGDLDNAAVVRQMRREIHCSTD